MNERRTRILVLAAIVWEFLARTVGTLCVHEVSPNEALLLEKIPHVVGVL